MKKQIIEVELELVEDQLGTVPKNRDVYTQYVATKVSPEVAAKELRKFFSHDISRSRALLSFIRGTSACR